MRRAGPRGDRVGGGPRDPPAGGGDPGDIGVATAVAVHHRGLRGRREPGVADPRGVRGVLVLVDQHDAQGAVGTVHGVGGDLVVGGRRGDHGVAGRAQLGEGLQAEVGVERRVGGRLADVADAAAAGEQAVVVEVGVAVDRAHLVGAVVGVPPVDVEDAVLQGRHVGVRGEQAVGAAVHLGVGVDLGERDADLRGALPGVAVDLAADLTQLPGQPGRPVERLVGARPARVGVDDHEVDRAGHGRQDRVVPVGRVALAGDPVGPVARGGQHGADLDRGVDGLHGLGVGEDVAGVLLGALVRVVVGLPAAAVVAVAVVLVADLPVLRPVPLGDVGVPDPVGGLLRGAGAVVGDDHRLAAGGADGAHERVEAGAGGHVSAGGGVVLPVVDVAVGAAGVAHHLHARGAHQVGDLRVVHVGVPDGGVHPERRLVDGAEADSGVDGDVHGRRVGGRGLGRLAGGGRARGNGGQRGDGGQCAGQHGDGAFTASAAGADGTGPDETDAA